MLESGADGFQKRSEREKTLGLRHRLASASDVRKVLVASATRPRNLSFMAVTSVLALAMLGLGMTISGLGILGLGVMLYGSKVINDAVREDFLAELYGLGTQQMAEAPALGDGSGELLLEFEGLDVKMRDAYEGVVTRRRQLKKQLAAGSANLQAAWPEGMRVCDTLLSLAQRLVARGQRLCAYLETTRLIELTDTCSSIRSKAESAKDLVAARTYRQALSIGQRHIQTHIEVEGLYERVLAQVMVIETTLAGTIAQTVKIAAIDDEEFSASRSLVAEELENLTNKVSILELSVDEVLCISDSPSREGQSAGPSKEPLVSRA